MTDKSPFTNKKAGNAFLIDPAKDTQGPGILVLHSWWGLNNWVKEFCGRLASEGYTVLAPDLLNGALPESEAEGEAVLGALNPNELSGLVMSSAQMLRAATKDASKPIGVVGFSMGASLSFWLSTKLPEVVNSVASFYGTQAIDFDNAKSDYLGLYGADDHLVSEDDRIATESFVQLGGNDTNFVVYPEAKHWFFEPGPNYDAAAADDAWNRLVRFFGDRLKMP